MTSEGFTIGLSLATTSPASIAARARARLSNSPRSTSSRSMRFLAADMVSSSRWARRSAPGRHANANFERGQVMPDVGGLFARDDQRRAVQFERMDHHQVVMVAEILDRQPVGVDMAILVRPDRGEAPD